jgi:hypothetical protein
VHGAFQAGAERLDEGRVPIRLRSETVVNVADREPERVLGAKEDERVEEGDRVGAARDAYEDVVPPGQEPSTDDGLPDRGGQR